MIVRFDDTRLPEGLGSKGWSLCRMTQAGLPVPLGFCITADGLHQIVPREVESALHRLGATAVSVRSSADEEDSSGASFAGIHATRLNIRMPQQVIRALEDIRESASSPAAIAYRRKQGLKRALRIAAVVQTMVFADAAGVLFIGDPLGAKDHLVIEASWGLGEGVAGGLVTPDRWILSLSGEVLSATIADKDVAVVASEEGTREINVEDSRRSVPCLTPAMLTELYTLASNCEALFGSRQDIEFAIDKHQVWLLQSRPIIR